MFRNINDVYLELTECYDNGLAVDENKIGEILYTEHFFFCNTSELLNKEAQMTIKKYNYCKPEIKESSQSFVDTKGLKHCLIEHIQTNEIYFYKEQINVILILKI